MEHKVREILGINKGRMIIVDIGAFVGGVARNFAGWYPNAVIYAVEACPKNFRVLQNTTVDYENICLLNAAICGYDGTVSFHTVSDPKCQKTHNGTSSRSNSIYTSPGRRFGAIKSVSVKAFTIDSLCLLFGIRHIDILKINSEGAEYEAIKPDAKFLEFTDLIAVQMHGRKLVKDFLKLRKEACGVLKKNFRLEYKTGPLKSKGHIDQIWLKKP